MADRSRDGAHDREDASRPTAYAGEDRQAATAGHRAAIDAAALAVVRRMIAPGHAAAAPPAVAHPLATSVGKELGVGLGVIVTEALAAVPSWNKPVLDASGKPVESVPGAQRIEGHDILKRHEEVVGPKITALVGKLPAGEIHDFVAGVGQGATEAPGDSYRLEAAVADLVHRYRKP